MAENNIASRIDHTLLKPEATEKDILRLCKEAHKFGAATVCIAPYYVEEASDILKESPVKICTAVAYPFGYSDLKTKGVQIENAIDNGADELEVVLNISAVKSGHWDYVKNEIDSLSTLISKDDKIMTLTIETGLMTKKEIIELCSICVASKVEFIRTSTEYGPKGHSIETIKLMKKHLMGEVQIKASGGIRSKKQALELIKAGAARLGSSSLLLNL